MRTSHTIGFAVEESDRARLDHLADVFGGGNRSAFLRVAMKVMDRYERAQRLSEIQAYGAERLAASGYGVEDIPDLVAKALADPSPEALAQADLIVAEISRRAAPILHEGSEDDDVLRAAYDAWSPVD